MTLIIYFFRLCMNRQGPGRYEMWCDGKGEWRYWQQLFLYGLKRERCSFKINFCSRPDLCRSRLRVNLLFPEKQIQNHNYTVTRDSETFRYHETIVVTRDRPKTTSESDFILRFYYCRDEWKFSKVRHLHPFPRLYNETGRVTQTIRWLVKV